MANLSISLRLGGITESFLLPFGRFALRRRIKQALFALIRNHLFCFHLAILHRGGPKWKLHIAFIWLFGSFASRGRILKKKQSILMDSCERQLNNTVNANSVNFINAN